MINVGILIQARLSSNRLPAKACLDIFGVPMLGFIIQRCKLLSLPIYILTSTNNEDDYILEIGKKYRVDEVYRGSLEDVRSRFLEFSLTKGLTHIIRLTGDNPLIDPFLIKNALDFSINKGYEYVSYDPKIMIEGLNPEIFTVSSLIESQENSKDCLDIEHVTPWIKKNKSTLYVPIPEHIINNIELSSSISFTVDLFEDYIKIINLLIQIPHKDLYKKDLLSIILEKINNGYEFPRGRRH
tara:strand:- start:2742 stop:3464 length:723 start_codon:yes stop_codon:yes gene_type:complete